MSSLRIVLLFVIALFIEEAYGQDLVLVSKVEKDSISIKWLPSNFDQLKQIANGATIYRVESSKPQNFQLVNFQNAKTWIIEPTKKRYEKLNLSTTTGEKADVLLSPLFDKSNPEELKNFSFGTALIENIINPEFQFILGNIIVDKSFNKNKTYVYKIEVKGMAPYFIFIDPKQVTKYSSINDLNLSLDQKKTVDVEWSAKRYEKEAFGFDIEHSVDEIKGGDFLTEIPYLPFKSNFEKEGKLAMYRDSPLPGHFHYYRIHGRDMFGHRELVSEWKKIYVPLLINAWAQIDTMYATSNQRVIKAGVYELEGKTNVKEVHLMRSSNKDTDFNLVEKVEYTDSLYSFSVNEEKTGDHYYYKILAINKDDTVASLPYYFFTLDQEPPSAPTNVSGVIDSSGVVTLNWEASIDDDIQGYKIFRANTKKEEFVEKTTRLFTTLNFTDTLALNNLTSDVYYFVQAVDDNFNQSVNSDTILIIKPDTIAPIACIVKDVQIEKGALRILWINSDSEDLKQSSLLRFNNQQIDTLITWSREYSEFIDSNIIGGQNYQYQIITADKSDNQTYSNEFKRFYEPGYRKKIDNFIGKVDVKQKSIVLCWDKPKAEIYSYQIYRAKGDGKMLPLKTLMDANQNTYKDNNVRLNNKYVYTVKYVNQSGIHSIPSKIEIIYQ